MKKDGLKKLIIIGAGPAGLSASVYASRYGIPHTLVGGFMGGLIAESHQVDNYLGLEGLSGFELSQKMVAHAKKYAPEIIMSQVLGIKKEKNLFQVSLEGEKELLTKTLILAPGTKRRKLNVSGENNFQAKGVSYCATCDGFFYKGKTVAVIGGGDSAVGAAVHLAQIAKKVYLICRDKKLSAEDYWKNLLQKSQKIEVLYETKVLEFLGKEKLEKIKIDKDSRGQKEVFIDGVFVEIGAEPNWDFAKDLNLEADSGGYLVVGDDASTSQDGVWAAGDITTGSNKFRQVITAASEGAIAAKSVFEYLKKE